MPCFSYGKGVHMSVTLYDPIETKKAKITKSSLSAPWKTLVLYSETSTIQTCTACLFLQFKPLDIECTDAWTSSGVGSQPAVTSAGCHVSHFTWKHTADSIRVCIKMKVFRYLFALFCIVQCKCQEKRLRLCTVSTQISNSEHRNDSSNQNNASNNNNNMIYFKMHHAYNFLLITISIT